MTNILTGAITAIQTETKADSESIWLIRVRLDSHPLTHFSPQTFYAHTRISRTNTPLTELVSAVVALGFSVLELLNLSRPKDEWDRRSKTALPSAVGC